MADQGLSPAIDLKSSTVGQWPSIGRMPFGDRFFGKINREITAFH
jgi:hypothetical protein